MAPRGLQEGSKRVQDGSKRAPRVPRQPQEGFKMVPRGFKRSPRDLQVAKTAPRALQEAPGSILEPFGNHLGVDFRVVLEPFEADDYTDVGR